MIQKIIVLMLKDMRAPCSYLPIGLGLGMVVALVLAWRLQYSNRKRKKKDLIKTGLFTTYLYVLAQQTFLSRIPGSRRSLDLMLFSTWIQTGAQGKAYVIENLLLFLPLGFFLPELFRSCRKEKAVVLVGFLGSVFIECMQYITRRGYTQIDDVLANTLGSILGFLLWKGWQRFRHRREIF